jgi:hypothetical protein
MPGTAQTTQFQFTTGTVLIGPMADQKKLNVKDHSIGLTKAVNFTLDTSMVELTQGLMNQTVASVVNKQTVKCAFEVYELTTRNLTYGLGLDATSPTAFAPVTFIAALAANVAAAATSFTIAGDHTAEIHTGSWVFLQEGVDDAIHIMKVATATFATPNTTVTVGAGYAIPTGMSFSSASGRVGLIQKVDSDPDLANKEFAIRIIGTGALDKRPVVLHMPRAKVTKGFALSFSADNFGNLPFEITPYVPTPIDPGYDSDFKFMFSVFNP